MYNNRKMDDMSRLKQQGGMINPRGMKVSGSNESRTITPIEGKKPRVYNATRGSGQGPIGYKPSNYSFYDLMTNPDDQELRDFSFEDWIFPEFKGDTTLYMQSQRILRRGRNDTAEGAQVGKATVTQYIYVLLNPSKAPVQAFGQYPGMIPKRSDYLVCVEVGDPRSGKLDGAFVQYALSLNTPVSKCVTLATTERSPEGGYQYFYQIQGDAELEKWIFDRWFNNDDYYFNGIIYPKIRAITEV